MQGSWHACALFFVTAGLTAGLTAGVAAALVVTIIFAVVPPPPVPTIAAPAASTGRPVGLLVAARSLLVIRWRCRAAVSHAARC